MVFLWHFWNKVDVLTLSRIYVETKLFILFSEFNKLSIWNIKYFISQNQLPIDTTPLKIYSVVVNILFIEMKFFLILFRNSGDCIAQKMKLAIQDFFIKFRSRHRRCYVKKVVLRNFAKFTGKSRCQSLFFDKFAGLRPATLFKRRL